MKLFKMLLITASLVGSAQAKTVLSMPEQLTLQKGKVNYLHNIMNPTITDFTARDFTPDSYSDVTLALQKLKKNYHNLIVYIDDTKPVLCGFTTQHYFDKIRKNIQHELESITCSESTAVVVVDKNYVEHSQSRSVIWDPFAITIQKHLKVENGRSVFHFVDGQERFYDSGTERMLGALNKIKTAIN